MPSVPSSPRVKLRATSRRVPRVRSAGKNGEEAVAEYDPEPNMKLSRALAVVLLLHVVAIGGIIAFSLIKDHGTARTANDTAGAASASVAEDAHLPAAATGHDGADGGARPPMHVVQRGETLTRIANANGVSLEALLAANVSSAAGGIHPGQQLRMPEKVSSPVPHSGSAGNEALNLIEQKSAAENDADIAAANMPMPTPSARPARPAADPGQTYTVGKGESPYTIAHKLKVSPEALLKLNGIDDPKKIKPGQKLRVPATKLDSGKPKLKA